MIQPAFEKRNTPIVVSIGNEYSPQLAVVLASIFENSSADNNYDILVLENDITDENKALLNNMVSERENFSLRYVPIAEYLKDWKVKMVAHVPARSYYRLLIPRLFDQYDKLLYIDTDLVVHHDLRELYETEMNGYYLAGVIDPDFTGQINQENFDTMEYEQKTLKLKDPFTYVQAGVLIFNISKINEDNKGAEFLERATIGYRYMDQDVLNTSCEGNIIHLDPRWNVINDCNHERIRDVISHAPENIYQGYLKARKDPYIVHYAGFLKPWSSGPDDDFSELFWHYAEMTPYYNQLREQQAHRKKGYLRRFADKLFPKGTKRRKALVKLIRR